MQSIASGSSGQSVPVTVTGSYSTTAFSFRPSGFLYTFNHLQSEQIWQISFSESIAYLHLFNAGNGI